MHDRKVNLVLKKRSDKSASSQSDFGPRDRKTFRLIWFQAHTSRN